ncbi:MAG TPA: DUF1501 domain-containing protein [Armatimonadota bacterium]|nr:DUF1501 domain-containing protein [Armatimonadota bacterium]
MLRILGKGARLCDGVSRRDLLCVGGLSVAGLTLPGLLRAEADTAPAGAGDRSFGRARSCILLYMTGGPPQHETWDPKPDASLEVRGPFNTIPSSLSGLQVGELMPQLARHAHRCAVIRSMATDVNAHTGSGYWMLTGRPHPNRSGESIPPDSSDWPSFGAVMKRLLPSGREMPPVVTLPEPIKNNPGIVVAGQNAGFMPAEYEPFLLECDPSSPDFRVPGLTPLPELPVARLDRRRSLLQQVNHSMDSALRGGTFARDDALSSQAWDLLTSGKTRRAFDLGAERPKLRERYGAHKFGQSCLLARRLVEAGVRLVTVHWPREPNDLDKGNPVWDTHSDHVARMKSNLMPPMDQGVSALLEDLVGRGMLEDTLVVWMGEFGRTPKFNPGGGRDHWGHVFSVMLAGGGIRPGIVHGESDRLGAYPEADRVGPEELHATLYHCLGVPPNAEITDKLGRPLRACEVEPIRPVLL